MRPFEEQTALERTLRSHLWAPTDLLRRASESLPVHVRKKEYKEAAQCQMSIMNARHDVAMWQHILDLYEIERQPQPRLAEAELPLDK